MNGDMYDWTTLNSLTCGLGTCSCRIKLFTRCAQKFVNNVSCSFVEVVHAFHNVTLW